MSDTPDQPPLRSIHSSTFPELLDRLGISDRPALSMGHVPISGAEGSLASLSQLSCRQKVYTHINNTNPMLVESSPERAAVEAAGMIAGMDGMRFEV